MSTISMGLDDGPLLPLRCPGCQKLLTRMRRVWRVRAHRLANGERCEWSHRDVTPQSPWANNGGARPGAGRKPSGRNRKARSVSLSPERWTQLDALGRALRDQAEPAPPNATGRSEAAEALVDLLSSKQPAKDLGRLRRLVKEIDTGG